MHVHVHSVHRVHVHVHVQFIVHLPVGDRQFDHRQDRFLFFCLRPPTPMLGYCCIVLCSLDSAPQPITGGRPLLCAEHR